LKEGGATELLWSLVRKGGIKSVNPKKEADMNNEIITNEEFSMNAGMISTVVAALIFIMAPIVLLATYFVKAPLW
jgi:hypothetical protein